MTIKLDLLFHKTEEYMTVIIVNLRTFEKQNIYYWYVSVFNLIYSVTAVCFYHLALLKHAFGNAVSFLHIINNLLWTTHRNFI